MGFYLSDNRNGNPGNKLCCQRPSPFCYPWRREPDLPPAGFLEQAARNQVRPARRRTEYDYAMLGMQNSIRRPVGFGPWSRGMVATQYAVDTRSMTDLINSRVDYLFPLVLVQETAAAQYYNSTIDTVWSRR